MTMIAPQVAVLLAAGRGRRLRPHTDHTPKPLLPVNGKPTLDYALEAVVNAGIKRVCLVTHYLEEQIVAHVGDGARWGLEVAFAHQAEMLGTGHALLTAMNAHPAWFQDGSLLLSATDYILQPDFLQALTDEQQRVEADLMVSMKQLKQHELSGRSSIRFGEGSAIDEIVEKPAVGQAPSSIGGSLIFILPAAIRTYLTALEPSPRGEYEVQGAINAMIVNGYSAFGLLQLAPPEWSPPDEK